MIGLYVHIPFCKHICKYCDFPKKIAKDKEQIRIYLNKLKAEILSYSSSFNKINTIYIGGGTPNALPIDLLDDLLSFLKCLNLNIKEFSIELNPEILNFEQVELFKKYNVNRFSLGAQTFNDDNLLFLGRHHKRNDIINAVNLLKDNGLNNINIDLIFGYFNETLEDVKNDLDNFLALNIPHLSFYSLILEENTRFYQEHKENELDEDLIADMYLYIINFMKKNGYMHYEISNFAKEGYESIHNLKYWNKDEYIGVGMGATTYLSQMRKTNSYFINNYLNDLDYDVEKLAIIDEKKEFIILGLRKINGIKKIDYYNRFNTNINDDFNYDKLLNNGLIFEDDKVLRLTDKGLFLANLVFEEFL